MDKCIKDVDTMCTVATATISYMDKTQGYPQSYPQHLSSYQHRVFATGVISVNMSHQN